jgi:dCMP deaminase
MVSHSFFYEVAKVCAAQSTCLSSHYGAVIVDANHHIISTGFNGAPKGKEHCTDKGWCLKRSFGYDHFQTSVKDWAGMSICNCVHTETNAIVNATAPVGGSTMYLYGERNGFPIVVKPCFLCCKMLINAGIQKVIIKSNNTFIEINMDELYEAYIQEIAQQHIIAITPT